MMSAPIFQNLAYELVENTAYLTLDRPEKRNALNDEMVAELHKALDFVEQEPGAKTLVLRANGRAFCAGADLSYLQKLQGFSFDENVIDSTNLKDLFWKFYSFPKIIIAQVEGHAIAGGCGLVNVCDIAFSVPEAKFGYTEVRIGFLPAIVMPFLVRKCGEAHAREMLLTGELYGAEEVKEKGLLNFIVQKDEIAQSVCTFAQNLSEKNSPSSMAMTKKLLASLHETKPSEIGNFTAVQNAKARETADCKKGIQSFLDKETPKW